MLPRRAWVRAPARGPGLSSGLAYPDPNVMRVVRRAVDGPVLVVAAVAGVLLGHWVGYRLIFPDPVAREAVLRAAGHGYWPYAVRSSVAMLAVALVAVAIRALAGSLSRDRCEDPHPIDVFARLAVLQMAGFAAMEVAERVMAGAPVAGLFHHHLFLVGLLLQVAVALAGTAFLVLMAGLGRRAAVVLAGHPSLSRRPALVAALAPRSGAVPGRLSLGGTGRRGPPSS